MKGFRALHLFLLSRIYPGATVQKRKKGVYGGDFCSSGPLRGLGRRRLGVPIDGVGSRRFAEEVWEKSVLTVADASEFLHGQDPKRASVRALGCFATPARVSVFNVENSYALKFGFY